jgi:hypothetical protein
MYDKYIGNIKGQKDTNETIQGLSLAQEHKMSAANVGTTYTADVQNIRTEMLSKYGLDSEALPSKTSTAGFKNEIQEIDEFDTTKYTDPTDPSTMK